MSGEQKWYVHLHGKNNLAGVEVNGVFHEDRGYYTIGGDRPMLYDEEALAWAGFDPLGDAVREATPDEVERGAKPIWGFPEHSGQWSVIDFEPDDGWTDGDISETVVVVYRGGSRWEHASPLKDLA